MHHVRRFRPLVPVACALLGAVQMVPRADEPEVHVRKQATEGNPTLFVASMDASEALASRFKSVVARCDWFTVVNSAEAATYLVSARQIVGTPPALDVKVSSTTGQLARFVQKAGRQDTDRLAFLAVDGLIRVLFSNPGLCATKIAFAVGVRRGDTVVKEVFTCNFDRTGARQLTHNSSISTEPSWGPKASSLVYTLYEQNTTSVVLVDRLRQTQRRLSTFPGLNAGAAVSPDGQWAALCLSQEKQVDLYLLHVSTRRIRALTRDVAVESSPCWSPNGTQICYVSDRAGRPQLYITTATTKARPRRLLRSTAETVSPDWSPLSNMICFATRMGEQYALGVVDMDNLAAGTQIVTNAAGDWEAPSWAPDGRHVVCSRRLDASRALWMVDTRHGRALPITKSGGVGAPDHSLPTWSDRF